MSEFNEDYFDYVLKKALESTLDDEIEETNKIFDILENDTTAPEPSLQHQTFMTNLVHESKKSSATRPHWRRYINIAAIIAIIFTSTYLSAKANNISIFKNLFGTSNNHYEVDLARKQEYDIIRGEAEDWNTIYVPGYIPDEYELSNITSTNRSIKIEYNNQEDDYIFYTITNIGFTGTYQFDSERGHLEIVIINGYEGYLYHEEWGDSIIYNDNLFVYQISVTDTTADIIRIVESIKSIE